MWQARFAIPAVDYLRALRLRGVMAKAVDETMRPYDALIAPSRQVIASEIDREMPSSQATDVMGAVGNLLGLPGITVPNGLAEGHADGSAVPGIGPMTRTGPSTRPGSTSRALTGIPITPAAGSSGPGPLGLSTADRLRVRECMTAGESGMAFDARCCVSLQLTTRPTPDRLRAWRCSRGEAIGVPKSPWIPHRDYAAASARKAQLCPTTSTCWASCCSLSREATASCRR